MAEFTVQSNSVDVTQIMEQIRQRIQEKRGRDYTEQQIRELATVKLDRFLDPLQVRSDLVEHYRQLEPPTALDPVRPYERPGPPPEPFDFNEHTIYASSRGTMGKLIRLIRRLLNPLLKLFVNPNPVVFALSRQSEINTWTLQLLQQQTDLAERVTKQFEQAGAKFAAREELDALNYEVLNNLVVEMTRLSVDMKNHRSLVESVAGRLDFDERRARALESVVQGRSPQPSPTPSEDGESPSTTAAGRTRRRRRRSRRRPGTATTATPAGGTTPDTAAAVGDQGDSAATAPDIPARTAAPDTATPPPDIAAPDPGPTTHREAIRPAPEVAPLATPSDPTPPPTTAAPSPAPDPPPAAAPSVADTGTPDPSPASPTPSGTPAAAAPTDTLAPSSLPGGAGTDEQ